MSGVPDPPAAGTLRQRASRRETAWMASGCCRDHPPEVFFPSDGAGVQAACHVCSGCPVARECLEFALACHIRYGVWGGASERARQRMAAERRSTAGGGRGRTARAGTRSS